MKVALILLLAVTGLSCNAAPPPAPREAGFDVRVKLDDIYNPNLTVTTLVRMNEPFVVRCSNGKIENTFWGQLHPAKNGKYPLDLSICEWESKESSTTAFGTYEIALGEIQSGGFVSSIIYLRTVTLQRHVPTP